jgi:phosphate-selective porin
MTFCVPLLFVVSLVADVAAAKPAQPAPAATGQHVVKGPSVESLTPHVQVTRHGRVLQMDYELLDAQGNKSPTVDRDHKPHFRICRDGQEIASGDFEYG